MNLDGLALFSKALLYENTLFKTRHTHNTKWTLAANSVGESFSKDLCKLSPNNPEVAHITHQMSIAWVKYITHIINSSSELNNDEFVVCTHLNKLAGDADWNQHHKSIGDAFVSDFSQRCADQQSIKIGKYMRMMWLKYVQHIAPQLTHMQLYLAPIPPQFEINKVFKSRKVMDAFEKYIQILLHKPSNETRIAKLMTKIRHELQILYPQRPDKVYNDASMEVFKSKHVDKFREWYAIQTDMQTYSDEEDIGDMLRRGRDQVEHTFDYTKCETPANPSKISEIEHAYFQVQSQQRELTNMNEKLGYKSKPYKPHFVLMDIKGVSYQLDINTQEIYDSTSTKIVGIMVKHVDDDTVSPRFFHK